jgi:hypothetical protein
MRHYWPVLAALLLAGGLAQAQMRGPAQRPPPHKPYSSVAVDIPPAPDDPSFAAFRQELADIAKRRVYAGLAAVVVARGFFWDRDFAGGSTRRKPASKISLLPSGSKPMAAPAGGGWPRSPPTRAPDPSLYGRV